MKITKLAIGGVSAVRNGKKYTAMTVFGNVDGAARQSALFCLVPWLMNHAMPALPELRAIMNAAPRGSATAEQQEAAVTEAFAYINTKFHAAHYAHRVGSMLESNAQRAARNIITQAGFTFETAYAIVEHAIRAYHNPGALEQWHVQGAAAHKAEAITQFIRQFSVSEVVAIAILKARNWCINTASREYAESRIAELEHEMRSEVPDGATWIDSDQWIEREALKAFLAGKPAPRVDLTKSTLAAPPSLVTIQTDTRRNTEIMEAHRQRIKAQREAREAVAQLAAPNPHTVAFMGFAIAAGVYTGHGNNPVRAWIDASGSTSPHVAIWDEIASYAVPLARIYDAAEEQPGVFGYEVAEEFGAWFYRCAMADKSTPYRDVCNNEIMRLASEFYALPVEMFAALVQA